MNIVICTSVGIVVMVTGLAAYIGLLFGICTATDKCNFRVPKEFSKWAGRVALTVAIAFAVCMILWLGHDIGCKVIHLTMRH